MTQHLYRRKFLGASAAAAFAPYFFSPETKAQDAPKVAGFDQTDSAHDPMQEWQPYTDRKLRVGLVGYGFCQFSAQFGFQDHPNVEVVAVSDLFPDRCAALSKRVKCEKTYESLEKMVEDDSIEAISALLTLPRMPNMRFCASNTASTSAMPFLSSMATPTGATSSSNAAKNIRI